MNTPEIVVHEVQSYGMSKVLDLLAESIGQASEAAYSQIESLNCCKSGGG